MLCEYPKRRPKDFFDDVSVFIYEGDLCRYIYLTKGHFAIVDAADYEWLTQWKWLSWTTKGRKTYAARLVGNEVFLMHREVLGLKRGEDTQGDHVDTLMTLDNRRRNLRTATFQQNQHNRTMYRCNKTGFKGVIQSARCSTFIARIRVNGELIRLGTRPTAKQAWEELYVPAAEKYHKEFSRVA
jgi:hypothetical protein